MRVFTVVQHEWQEGLRNRLLLFSVALPPVIFALIPVVMVLLAGMEPMSPRELGPLYQMDPSLRGLDPVEATQVLLITQFMLFFLMIPAVAPLVIASFSIIGEKQARSLEPLLATPIAVWELLIGKCVAAVVPGVLSTWLGYGLAVVGILLGGTRLAFLAAVHPIWLLSMVSVAPLIGVASVGLAIIVSSRVNDTRVAQQISGLLILPIMGLFVGQMAGLVLISVPMVLVGAVGLVVVDAAIMYLAVHLFRREKILVDWR